MRLLNTLVQPPKLENFFGREVPEYAILSHRWGPEEVSYKHYVKQQSIGQLGYNKIVETCKFVHQQHEGNINEPQYAWVDTCCIDKRSSSELSRAINSMYGYYEKAHRCYVYLSDVKFRPCPHYGQSSPGCGCESQYDRDQQIKTSKWFTRGWTLQELLANQDTVFLNYQWEIIGTKSTHVDYAGHFGSNLGRLVSRTTGIDSRYLDDPRRLSEASVASKMSWAARRDTTEEEDRAYSLLGIFGINMTPRYGEGAQSFQRLQKKIIATSTDQSVLAWQIDQPAALEGYGRPMGVLAPGPEDFAHCRGIVFDTKAAAWSCTMTGLGLEIKAQCRTARVARYGLGLLVLQLNCSERKTTRPSGHKLAKEMMLLEIETQSPSQEPRLYYRIPDEQYHEIEMSISDIDFKASDHLKHICIKTADPSHWSLECPLYWKFMHEMKGRGRK